MKTSQDIANGFPPNQRSRGNVVRTTAIRETSLALAGEVEKILDIFAADPAEAIITVRAWIRSTREAAEKESQ